MKTVSLTKPKVKRQKRRGEKGKRGNGATLVIPFPISPLHLFPLPLSSMRRHHHPVSGPQGDEGLKLYRMRWDVAHTPLMRERGY